MARKLTTKRELTGKARLHAAIVQMKRDQHALGMVSDAALEKTTLRMLGAAALPKVVRLRRRRQSRPPASP
jgi:hypothetical protein